MSQLVASGAAAAPASQLPSRKLAVWLFLASEVLFFSALILGSVAIRVTSNAWPSYAQISHVLNVPLTALNTFFLILSSVMVVLALNAIQNGDRRRLVIFMGATLLLGVTFLSIQGFEYRLLWSEGLTIRSVPQSVMPQADSLFGSTFYAMTSFHGLHVLAGVLTLSLVLARAIRGHYTQDSHEAVELFGLYWHFVDVVWIVLFTVVYLL